MKVEKITFSAGPHRGERTVSTQELKDWHKENYGKYADSWHVFEDGWKSTSKKSPEKGGLFIDIAPEDAPVVSFTDKYGKKHVGILKSFGFEKFLGKVTCIVRSNRVNPFHQGENLVEGTINCMLMPKHLTLVEGVMPKLPAEPTMK